MLGLIADAVAQVRAPGTAIALLAERGQIGANVPAPMLAAQVDLLRLGYPANRLRARHDLRHHPAR